MMKKAWGATRAAAATAAAGAAALRNVESYMQQRVKENEEDRSREHAATEEEEEEEEEQQQEEEKLSAAEETELVQETIEDSWKNKLVQQTIEENPARPRGVRAEWETDSSAARSRLRNLDTRNLSKGSITSKGLAHLSIKQLRSLMKQHRVTCSHCVEKQHLVEALMRAGAKAASFGIIDDKKPPGSSCCKVCSNGKACGHSCISKGKTCSKPKGCACDVSKKPSSPTPRASSPSSPSSSSSPELHEVRVKQARNAAELRHLHHLVSELVPLKKKAAAHANEMQMKLDSLTINATNTKQRNVNAKEQWRKHKLHQHQRSATAQRHCTMRNNATTTAPPPHRGIMNRGNDTTTATSAAAADTKKKKPTQEKVTAMHWLTWGVAALAFLSLLMRLQYMRCIVCLVSTIFCALVLLFPSSPHLVLATLLSLPLLCLTLKRIGTSKNRAPVVVLVDGNHQPASCLDEQSEFVQQRALANFEVYHRRSATLDDVRLSSAGIMGWFDGGAMLGQQHEENEVVEQDRPEGCEPASSESEESSSPDHYVSLLDRAMEHHTPLMLRYAGGSTPHALRSFTPLKWEDGIKSRLLALCHTSRSPKSFLTRRIVELYEDSAPEQSCTAVPAPKSVAEEHRRMRQMSSLRSLTPSPSRRCNTWGSAWMWPSSHCKQRPATYRLRWSLYSLHQPMKMILMLMLMLILLLLLGPAPIPRHNTDDCWMD